mmetsp:Transcript_15996/g.40124  ORF Transcript_15996/g.40124 Transcript_15996/m.40124 type:complete len:181 (-) Transcript_15996:327-869(-)
MNTSMQYPIAILSLFCVIPQSMSLTTTQIQWHDLGGRKSCHRLTETFPAILQASSNNGLSEESISEQEEKFKIVTCMSTACSQRRKSLGMDSLSTFGAMFSRASASGVKVEEGPCIGFCKKGPCVAIEHEDFFGSVALEGMTADEFASDAFLNIVTEEDADRVWSCVENAVRVMAEAEEE